MVSQATGRAWANDDDATENGAYALVLAAIEEELGVVAIHRAPTKTGCDYYLGTTTAEDELNLESAVRLEVSGVDHGPLSAVRVRLAQKVNQAARVPSNLPAMAGVAGFRVRRVLLRNVDGP